MIKKINRFSFVVSGILTAAIMFLSADSLFAADEAYVMGYFTENPGYGEAQYSLHLAYSYDGLNYIPLNQNEPVAIPTLGSKGLRDPFILRKQDGNFVVLGTNMIGINMGANRSQFLHCWDSNDGLRTFINYRALKVNNTTTMHAWAPEAFWDPGRKQYAVIWAGNTDRNRLYVSYTADFITVSNVNSLTVFHDPGYDIYDGDMLMNNGTNYFYNANGTIHGWKGTSLDPKSFTNNYVPALKPSGASIEAPTVIKKIDDNIFWIWGDSYSPVNALFYVYQTDDIATNSWKLMDRRLFEGPPNGKHNTICKVSLQELNDLITKWGNPKWQRIKSYNLPERFIRHKNSTGVIDVSVVDPMADSKWKIVPGLADNNGISFESVSRPNYYLRHSNSAIVLNSNDNSTTFKSDATFYKTKGFADTSWVSFRAYAYTDRYIRHSSNTLRIDPISTNTEKQDATFKIFYEISSQQTSTSNALLAKQNALTNKPVTRSVANASVTFLGKSRVQIFDMSGKVLFNSTIKNPGTYQIKQFLPGSMSDQKVVLVKIRQVQDLK